MELFWAKFNIPSLFCGLSKKVVEASSSNVASTIGNTFPSETHRLAYGANWIPYNEIIIVEPTVEEELENTEQPIQEINNDDYPIWLGI